MDWPGMGGRRLTAWAMARPNHSLSLQCLYRTSVTFTYVGLFVN
jgi:hypothetical protein